MCDQAGQMLWFPPNVSGWNDNAWLNTSTHSYRWDFVTTLMDDGQLDPADDDGQDERPEQAVARALSFWGNPEITDSQRASLLAFAGAAMSTDYWSDAARRAYRQNALRTLVCAAPDAQVS